MLLLPKSRAFKKKQCISMRNDRAKGIFRTNITAPLSKRRQTASTEATEEEVECATAEASLQYDAFNLLNQYRV